MTIYHLPAKPEIAQGMQRGYPVSDRLHSIAEQAGYIIGPGGIQVYADGSVTIDTDHDPSPQWETFNPLTMLTPKENAAQSEHAQLQTIYPKLRAGTATSREVQGALAFVLREIRADVFG